MATDIESRRDALLTAMIRVVGRKGYDATSVADVIAEAGTSRTTFYKNFDDKHDCFLAAYERMVEQVFDTIVSECNGEQPWISRVRRGLETLVEIFALEPELARTAVVEVAAAGADARRLHWDAINRFRGYMEAGREIEPGKELPEQISVMAVGAVSGLIFDELIAGRAEHLRELMPDLLFAMLVPYIGPTAAADEMRRAAQAA
jgi:AcrR family transcriptional regulator